jgi:hypothetical protein
MIVASRFIQGTLKQEALKVGKPTHDADEDTRKSMLVPFGCHRLPQVL